MACIIASFVIGEKNVKKSRVDLTEDENLKNDLA